MFKNSQPSSASRQPRLSDPGMRVIHARYPGQCGHCQGPINPGDQCLHGPAPRGSNRASAIYHLGLCPTPHIVKGPSPANPVDYVPPDGTYTVVLPDGHVTVLIETQPPDAQFAPGERVISRLIGPDNSRDFLAFGFLTLSGSIRFWRRVANDWTSATRERLWAVARALHRDPVAAQQAGEAYAQRSGRCCRCGRKLTVPASLHRGMGPVCARGGQDPDV